MKIEDVKLPEDILFWAKSKGHVVFDSRPWDLNIIGVRRKNGVPNRFDDRIFVVCKDDAEVLRMWSWAVTTDPGLFWMQNPMNKLGTACLVPGQYRGCWQIGLHSGKPALKQIKTVKTYRDSNKDAILDLDPSTISEGLYGINIHRAGNDSQSVDKWSAGCQVFPRDADFDDFMELCNKQVTAARYTTFSYTLLEEED